LKRAVQRSELERTRALERRAVLLPPPEALERAAGSILRLIASILDGAPARVFVVGSEGLEPVISVGRIWTGETPVVPNHREHVPTGNGTRPSVVANPSGDVAQLLLLSGRRLMGLVEVAARPEVVEERRSLLEEAARHGAALLESVAAELDLRRRLHAQSHEDARTQQAIGELDEMVLLQQDLIGFKSPKSAIRSLITFCSKHYRTPVAAWLRQPGKQRLHLVACKTFGTDGCRELRAKMRTIPSNGKAPYPQQLVSQFVSIARVRDAVALDLGDFIVMWGTTGVDSDAHICTLARYVEGLLTQLSMVERGQQYSERVDEGIALAAHEMKSPLVATMAVIDLVLANGADDDRKRYLLKRSRQELGKLSELTVSLLSSARGPQPGEFTETDLVGILKQAADSCSWEAGEGRVIIDSPPIVFVRGDANQLRAAVASLIRNALTYTRANDEVTVKMRNEEGRATVSVRDRGPAASETELAAILDPAMRSEKSGPRAGRTLGLLVATRVARGHGGRVWAEPCGNGATIYLQLPSLSGRQPRICV
jgi:signal transduction histidine kinase